MRQYYGTEVMDDLFKLYKAYMQVVRDDQIKEDFQSMKQFEDTFEDIWVKYKEV